jgi:hypothetical protein
MVDYIQVMGLIMLDCVCRAIQPFLSRFWSVLTDFGPISRLRGSKDPLNAPHVPSHGAREAPGTHLCRLGPWAGPGWGMSLKISRAARHKPIADLQGFCRCLEIHKLRGGGEDGFRCRAPMSQAARRRGNSDALVIPGSTVVKCIRMVGLIVFGCGCEAYQSFLSRSRSDFRRF